MGSDQDRDELVTAARALLDVLNSQGSMIELGQRLAQNGSKGHVFRGVLHDAKKALAAALEREQNDGDLGADS